MKPGDTLQEFVGETLDLFEDLKIQSAAVSYDHNISQMGMPKSGEIPPGTGATIRVTIVGKYKTPRPELPSGDRFLLEAKEDLDDARETVKLIEAEIGEARKK